MKATITALLLVFSVALFDFLPASAADKGLYLPFTAYDWSLKTWFTEDELLEAMWEAGLDPAIWLPHTNCDLAPETTPERVAYSFCSTDLTPENTGDAREMVFFWDIEMVAIEITGETK